MSENNDPKCVVVPATAIANAHHDAERDGEGRATLERLRNEHGKCFSTTCDIAYLVQLLELATASHTTSKVSHVSQRRAWVAEKQSLLHVIYRVSGKPVTEHRDGSSIRCEACQTKIPVDSPHLAEGRCPVCGADI